MPIEKAQPVQAEAPADPRAKLAWEIVTHYVHGLGSFGLPHPTQIPAYAGHEKALAGLQLETLEQLRELFRKNSEALAGHAEAKANLLLAVDLMVERFGDNIACYGRVFEAVGKSPGRYVNQEGFRLLQAIIKEAEFAPFGVPPG